MTKPVPKAYVDPANLTPSKASGVTCPIRQFSACLGAGCAAWRWVEIGGVGRCGLAH